MNKSLVTNLAAAICILIGYLVPAVKEYFLSVGFFALSGGLTNWIAIYMLFERVPFLYGSGVIPNHFEEFKSGIRNLMMTEFFTKQNLDRFLSNSSSLPEINISKAIDAVDYNSVFDSLVQIIMASKIGGMLNMIGGQAALEVYREPFINKIQDFVREEVKKPAFKQAVSESLESGSLTENIEKQVESIVQSRLDELTPQMVKKIIQDMIRKHLGWLVVWGGVFGGLIGLVMALLKLN